MYLKTAMINKIDGQPVLLSWGENSICTLQVVNQKEAHCVIAKYGISNGLPTLYFFLTDDLHLSKDSVITEGNIFQLNISKDCIDDYERFYNDLQHIIVFTD